MNYTRLTDDERYDIYEMRREGASLTSIAEALNRSKSTVSRELRRNIGERGYRPKQAHALAQKRAKTRRGGRLVCAKAWARCKELLVNGFSPEQASGRSAREGFLSISHETIYARVYKDLRAGGALHTHLRCKKKRRKRYGSGRQKRGRISNRVGIEARSPAIEQRSTFGHWEGDTVIGRNHKKAIVTLVERKSGAGLAVLVKTKHAHGVADAVIGSLKSLGNVVKSITFDNGLEFAAHERIAAALKCKIYFANPYSSWERGTNENWNGLLREFFPKKSSFSDITTVALTHATQKLNSRARKRLAYQTPIEVLRPALKRAGVALAL